MTNARMVMVDCFHTNHLGEWKTLIRVSGWGTITHILRGTRIEKPRNATRGVRVDRAVAIRRTTRTVHFSRIGKENTRDENQEKGNDHFIYCE
jgi:hypothetical protein